MALVRSTETGAEKRARRRTLLGDLHSAIPDALAAVVLAGVVFWILMMRVRAGQDPAAREMPAMIGNGGITSYSLSQALGWAALLWSWLTILIGVSLPYWSRQGRPRLRETTERLHRSTSLSLIALIVLHAVLLCWDRMGDTLVTSFVPFMTSYKPGLWPEALGIFSFYLAMLLGASFYLRDRIGWRIWRLTHRYVIPGVYVLALWHAFLYGSDVQAHNELWIALWSMQVPVAAAFFIRFSVPLLSTARHKRKS